MILHVSIWWDIVFCMYLSESQILANIFTCNAMNFRCVFHPWFSQWFLLGRQIRSYVITLARWRSSLLKSGIACEHQKDVTCEARVSKPTFQRDVWCANEVTKNVSQKNMCKKTCVKQLPKPWPQTFGF